MHVMITYIPASHVESVKQAMFTAGAGQIGNYDQCCWQILGEGQFRALPGSDPFVGETGTVHREPEYRVEMVCADNNLDAVIRALLAAHPYEEPAWATWPVRSSL